MPPHAGGRHAAPTGAPADPLAAVTARLDATRRALVAVAGARAVLVGAAVALAVRLADALVGLARAPVTHPPGVPAGWPHAGALAVAAGLVAAALAGVRAARRGTWRRTSVALWIEERVPALRYALVTLADALPERGVRSAGRPVPAPDAAPTPGSDPAITHALARPVAATPWSDAVRRAARRALLAPSVAVLVLGAALAALPRVRPVAVADRGPAPRVAGTPAPRSAASPIDPLATLRATVTPPAYTRQPARTLADPATVDGIAGSVLVVEGDGPAPAVRAALVGARSTPPTGAPAGRPSTASADAAGGTPLPVRSAGRRWRVALVLPDSPAVLRLAAGDGVTGRTRLLVLAPRPDRAPTVTLALPARDTVVRAPQGTHPLRATIDDDLGITSAAFEYIVSSGEGESFKFRSGTLAARPLGGARRGALAHTLDLAALALAPGDVVHLRAVARDANPRGAPAASESRILRVARAGEYDSLSVAAAPPAQGDTAALSQRMLLQLTEALARRAAARPPLARPAVVAESRRIAADQARLRRRVGDIVFSRLGGPDAAGEHAHFAGDGHQHGESEPLRQLTPEQMLEAASRATGSGAAPTAEGDEAPVVAVNKPLLEAYNAMWDAGRALEVAEPAAAIPPMRRAIAAIQKVREAERFYLRGRPPAVVVDLGKVRGAGKLRADTLRPAPRAPAWAPSDAGARDRARSLDRALALLARDPAAAADTLALLRLRALGAAPALAAALGEAGEAIRTGRDATPSLVRARRAALGPAVSEATGGWGGALPALPVGEVRP